MGERIVNFRSDNTAAVAPEILTALAEANLGRAAAYGADDWSLRLEQDFGKLFERRVKVFTVASGTAANSISLASIVRPWGAILCHREAHIECDECGAPEFFSGGAKLVLIDGAAAKIDAAGLAAAATRHERGVHSVVPQAVSLTQASERGAIYSPDELRAIGAVARQRGLKVHMDGARFANAVAALGCKPADTTWKVGVDVLSFGATKNGAISAEAIVCFDLGLAEDIARRRKRGGHLFSKGRYQAAQWAAYLDNDLWLRLARRANGLASRLGEAAQGFLSCPVETNQVFMKPGVDALRRLREGGADFYDWGVEGSGEARLVVSWDQDEADIDAMCRLLLQLG
jgi:threonine aldolase